MALRKADKRQLEAIAAITDCTFASIDVAVNACTDFLSELRKHPQLIRHEIKMYVNNLKRTIHEYHTGCVRLMDGNAEFLAEFNDVMDGYTANNVEMLRLAFRQLFSRVGASDPALCSYAETAVSVSSFANQVYESMCRKCIDVGLTSPKYTATPFLKSQALLRDATMLTELICRKSGVPHFDFNKDKQSVDAFDALTRKLLDGKKLTEAIERAWKERRKDGTGTGEERTA